MTITDDDIRRFARLVDALEPWLDRVLFIGGWAHRLFRERPEAARLSYPPLRTGDVDVALDPRALEPDAGIRERLAASGFREEFFGDDRPPVTIRAGEAFVEPAGVRMTGRNLDAEQPTSMAIFYVCDPDTPFADPV